MKKFLAVILILTLPIYAGGCISGGGGGGDSGGPGGGGSAALDKSDVTLVFNFSDMLAMNSVDKDVMLAKIIDFITMAETAYAAPLYDYVTTLYIKVTGDGMADIEHTQDISYVEGSFSVTLTVPNGDDRIFYVELKDRNGFVLYSGTIIIDVGDYQGTPQDITIDVTIKEGISAEDYIDIGREHLEESALEKAFIAFDTAVSIDADHPVANFFRGFTKLLLLVQKDDPDADVTSPDADITSVLNYYIYGLTDSIYTSEDNIAPDIYNENYGDNLGIFFETWQRPADLITDDGVDLIEDVVLPEIENVIRDLANAEKDKVFYTTLTTSMHFGISSLIKVDRGDIYILETIAYGLKAYYNHILAYQLRADIDEWVNKLDNYTGIQNIIDSRTNNEGELVGAADDYLGRARTAYSSGLDKLKSGLQLIDRRSSVNKEDHIFNIADGDDTDIESIIGYIDDVKLALDGPTDINFDEDNARLDLSRLFSTPDINSLPKFYYHSISDTDMPIFDTNDPHPTFDPSFGGVIIEVNNRQIYNTADLRDALVNALREEILPMGYKFNVPTKTVEEMTGDIDDFSGVWPVMVDEEEGEKTEWSDLTDIYMTKDDNYLYIGMKFRDTPYNPDYLQNDEWLTYHISFNAKYSRCDWYNAPVIVELNGTSEGWSFDLHSYGSYEPVITSLSDHDCTYNVDGNIIEFKIPLNKLVEWIKDYQRKDSPDGWDGKEVFVAVSFWGRVSSEEGGDHIGDCLAGLNIDIGE